MNTMPEDLLRHMTTFIPQMYYVISNERYNEILGIFTSLEKVLEVLSKKEKFEYYFGKGICPNTCFIMVTRHTQKELEDIIVNSNDDENFQIVGHNHNEFGVFYNKVKNGATWEDLEEDFYGDDDDDYE